MTTRGRRRLLTETEIALWRAVTETVRPREGATRPVSPAPADPAPAPPPAPAIAETSAPFLPPSVRPAQRRIAQLPLAPFEKRYRQKVTRGRVAIDGAIDLHGMTQPQAHAALAGFLRVSAAEGARLVLVVTGKGRAGAEAGREPGVLRRSVPQWLRAEDLRRIVMGFEEAGQPHGGLGALYVRLRRREG